MMTTRNLSLHLLLGVGLLATGCAAETVGPGPDDPFDPNDPADPDLPVPTSPEGSFAVTSTFDIATNAPGTPGTIANYFIDATDDPDDPTKFIVDRLIEQLPSGSIKNFVQSSAPFVTGYLNDRLLEIAPNFLTKLVDIGDAFGQVTKNFSTKETLQIQASGATTKTVTGLFFKIDNVEMEFPFADYGIAETKVEGLQATLSQSGQLAISDHMVPMKYGQVLKLAIDQAIVPMIDPSATELSDILKNLVNCQKVGQFVFDAVGIGSPSTFESACNGGLDAAGKAIYKALDNMDAAALEFQLAGAARGVDKNGDGKMDDIQTGTYTGELRYAGSPAPLAGAKFYGTRK